MGNRLNGIAMAQVARVFRDGTPFDSPNDPNARAVRNERIQVAYDLSSKKQRGVAAIDRMIVPAVALTDVSEIKARISN